MERIHRPPDQPSPTGPASSCAARILASAATELERAGTSRVITRARLRCVIDDAAAAVLYRLPARALAQVARRAWASIPYGIDGNTYGVQARVLRGTARRLG
ncbi:hypothetical protein [Streptomyces aureocirculatus]|uniref:hypothetical protein n=1 Tax=Streptomyces aureocirculatus TaxID=67275 RepID=UPI0004CA4ED7|nr:hypothetical protein [Streptomyces aureocirculatus]